MDREREERDVTKTHTDHE